jgi:hypothetical protein
MVPDIQSIFDSTSSADGAWFFVGKYSSWTLYGINTNDGIISVEASSISTIQLNNIQNPTYQPLAQPWMPSTTYEPGSYILDYNNNVQKTTAGGFSGETPPTWATSGTTLDGTITWTFQAAQGDPNFNSATTSSASPIGVVICPSMATAGVLTITGYGTVNFTTPNGIYNPTDDLFVGYIRVRKTAGVGGAINGNSLGAAGSGYAPGDTGTINGGTGGTYSVVTITADPVAAQLGSAANYALLAYSGITSTGTSTVTGGNIGSAPTTGSETNFTFTPPAMIDNANAGAARIAGNSAFTYYSSLTPTQTGLSNLSTNNGGGGVGVYRAGVFSGGALDIPTSITLDAQGNASALFVFISATTTTLESGASILLINNAQAENVIWVVGSSFTAASPSATTMVGNILAYTSITLNGGTLNGRALAVGGGDGAVTIAAPENITVPTALGGVVTYSITAPGSGYSVATETTAATSGIGTGFTINITSVSSGGGGGGTVETIVYLAGQIDS